MYVPKINVKRTVVKSNGLGLKIIQARILNKNYLLMMKSWLKYYFLTIKNVF